MYTVSRIPEKIRARDCGCKTTTSLEWNTPGKYVHSRAWVNTWFSGILQAHQRKYSDFTGTYCDPSGPLAEIFRLYWCFWVILQAPWRNFSEYGQFSGILPALGWNFSDFMGDFQESFRYSDFMHAFPTFLERYEAFLNQFSFSIW